MLSLRMGTTVAGQIRKRVKDQARRPDARPFRPVRRQLPLRLPRRPVQHRPHANQRRRLVPDGRHPRRSRSRLKSSPATSAWTIRTLHRHRPHPFAEHGRVSLGRNRRRRNPPGLQSCRLQHGRRPHLPRTRRRHPRQNLRASRWKREPACSGVVLYLGLDRAYEHLAHHDFVFSRDPEESSSTTSTTRASQRRIPPATSQPPARTEPGVAPPGGESLYILVHTPYLRPHHDWVEDAPRPTARSFSTSSPAPPA